MSERNLAILLRTMNPTLHGEPVVFCTLRNLTDIPLEAIASFREAEGLTLVMPRSVAEELEIGFSYVAAWITLTVHSDLEAVGFLAAVTQSLAAAGISCNVFSAVYHDHLFVPFARGEDALSVLRVLSTED